MSAVREELLEMFAHFELWSMLAWSDTKLRYRRTRIGPFWVTISTGFTVLSVGLVYGHLFGLPTTEGQAGYVPYFAAGIIVWGFINATLSEGCTVFVQSAGLIKALRIPLLLHVFRMMARNIVLVAHNAVILILLWLVLQWHLGPGVLLAFAGFAILTSTLFGLVLVLGVFCARFRDIQQIVAAILQLMFLLTPIIWPPSGLKGKTELIYKLNPLYHLIEVVRAPLLGQTVEPLTWIVAIASAALALAAGLAVYARFQRRIAYWL